MIDLGNASYGPRSFHRTYLKKSPMKNPAAPLLLNMGGLLFFVFFLPKGSQGWGAVGCGTCVMLTTIIHQQSEIREAEMLSSI